MSTFKAYNGRKVVQACTLKSHFTKFGVMKDTLQSDPEVGVAAKILCNKKPKRRGREKRAVNCVDRRQTELSDHTQDPLRSAISLLQVDACQRTTVTSNELAHALLSIRCPGRERAGAKMFSNVVNGGMLE